MLVIICVFVRILCDGWLELTLDDPDEAEAVLSAAVKLRSTWQQLLELKLEGNRWPSSYLMLTDLDEVCMCTVCIEWQWYDIQFIFQWDLNPQLPYH